LKSFHLRAKFSRTKSHSRAARGDNTMYMQHVHLVSILMLENILLGTHWGHCSIDSQQDQAISHGSEIARRIFWLRQKATLHSNKARWRTSLILELMASIGRLLMMRKFVGAGRL